MTMIRLFVALVVFSTFALPLHAQSEAEADRKVMPEIVKLLGSPYTLERVEGIRRAAELSDRELVAEFKILERLTRIARSRARFARERSEALQALVQYAVTRVISSDELLDHMRKIIRNEKDKLEVRIDALRLLAEFGSVPIEERDLKMAEVIKRLHGMVKEIADDKSSKNPKQLRGASLVALGSIVGNKVLGATERREAEKIILASMRDRSAVVRESAMEALLYYVDSSMNNDAQLLRRILETVAKGDRVTAQARIAAIKAFESMLVYEVKLTSTMHKDLGKFLVSQVRNGSDEELIAASRCLLRIQDSKSLMGYMGVFIEELTKRPHELQAQQALVMSLVEMIGPLGAMVEDGGRASSSDKKKISSAVKDVTEFLSKLLLAKTAKPELRNLAASGLGSIPMVFSRRKGVEALLEVLKVEVGAAGEEGELSVLGTEALASLVQIGRMLPFKTKEGKVDLEAWDAWFEKHRRNLSAGEAPWLGGEDD
ncbi:MAG: hypothetical protein ACYTGH_10250 [Planctomycetota bacterium]|jgi:hypothetical protein